VLEIVSTAIPYIIPASEKEAGNFYIKEGKKIFQKSLVGPFYWTLFPVYCPHRTRKSKWNLKGDHIMKKLSTVVFAAILALALCSCASKKPAETTPPETMPPVATTAPTVAPTETTAPTEATEATQPETEPVTEPTAPKGYEGIVVNATTLNIRKDASVNSDKVGKFDKGATVTIYEKKYQDNAYWGRTDQGWVSMQYIKLTSGTLNDIPTAQATEEPDHQHNYEAKYTQPTCEERGFTTYTCSCGSKYADKYTDALGHNWGSWTVVKEATQYASGLAQRKCTRCGKQEDRQVDKIVAGHTHSYTGKVTTEATCTKTGVKTFTCSCGGKYTESIPKLGHSYITKVVAPTCNAGGYTEHTCRNCGNSYQDTPTKATAHSYSAKVIAPACEKAGHTEHTCSICGDVYTDSITPATGHNWGSWTVTKEPTTNDTGMKHRSCTVCGKEETETIARLEEPAKPTEHVHSWGLAEEVFPTCTTDGYWIRKCPCGATETKPTYSPAFGHSYSAVASTAPDCTHDGSVTYRCSTCGDTYTESVPAAHSWEHHHEDEVGHKDVRVVCHCGGWSCSVDEDYVGLFTKHTESLPLDERYDGHSYYSVSTWVVDVPAKDWDVCTVCGTTK